MQEEIEKGLYARALDAMVEMAEESIAPPREEVGAKDGLAMMMMASMVEASTMVNGAAAVVAAMFGKEKRDVQHDFSDAMLAPRVPRDAVSK